MLAMALRGSAREIVLVNRTFERAKGAVTDRYGAVLAPAVHLRAGHYADRRAAAIVVVTAGANEKAGGATDRSDPAGRLRLLGTNARIHREMVPRIVEAAPQDVHRPLYLVRRTQVGGHGLAAAPEARQQAAAPSRHRPHCSSPSSRTRMAAGSKGFLDRRPCRAGAVRRRRGGRGPRLST
jgi:hypothetical protein